MKFSKSELDIIYQYAAPTKAETLAGMKEIVPVIKDLLTKAIVENAIRKLEKIPEPECSQFVAATKARFLAERDNSIRQRLAAAKLQEPIMQGHDPVSYTHLRATMTLPRCGISLTNGW